MPRDCAADSLPDVSDAASIDSLFQSALREHQNGRIGQAAEMYRRVLSLQPDHADALHLLGVTELQAGRAAVAIELISRAIALRPQSSAYRSNLGEALRQAKRVPEAIAVLQSAVELDPTSAPAMTNLGLAFQQANRASEAERWLRAALARDPNALAASVALAKLLTDSGRLDESFAILQRVLAVAPNLSDAKIAMGLVLSMGGRVADAVDLLRACVAVEPRSAAAWTNLGMALLDFGDATAALEAQQTASALDPASAAIAGSVLFTSHYVAGLNPRDIATAHRAWGEKRAHPITARAQPCMNLADRSRRLKVGYVSGDFRAHPVGEFLLPILREHDRAQVEVYCYSNAAIADEMTNRIRAATDHWRDLHGQSDSDAADMIRADAIDVLVDLSGHTGSSRLLVFAHKPAPVQMTWLGYPDTTGMEAIDYRITDSIADPPGASDELHVEELVRLAAPFLCYRPAEDSPAIVEREVSKAPITFGSFNRPAKISPKALDLWCRVLRAVEGSRLIVKGVNLGDAATVHAWRQRFVARGVDANRVEFIGPVASHHEHLTIVSSVDVALDTFPYAGTMTTCESLWMGVPVVTLVGQTHVARVGLSLLSSVGLEDLAAKGENEFVAKAAALANDPDQRAELRRTLRDGLRASPLLDAEATARKLESAYREAWTTWCDDPTAQADAAFARGNALNAQRRSPEAIVEWENALKLVPDHVPSMMNLGAVCMSGGMLARSASLFSQVAKRWPRYFGAHNNLGNVLLQQGRLAEARSAYERAIELAPSDPAVHSNLPFLLQHDANCSAAELRDAHRQWAKQHAPPVRVSHSNTRDPDRVLRVGYVSGDFAQTPSSFFIEPVLAGHDRSQFFVACYSNRTSRDATTDRLRSAADLWRDVAGLSDDALAGQIAADGIDILVDLSVHSNANRLPAFARKPAPVQISYLGYPGTTGMPAMDYRIGDVHLDPSEANEDVESIIRLPRTYYCYRPPTDAPAVAPLPARANGLVTFGSFNKLAKLSDDAVTLWARVLTSLPNARLVLQANGLNDPDTRHYWLDRFASLGVDPSRVEPRGFMALSDYLAALSKVDIGLDPFPFNGATTTLHAMWMGVPTVTLEGKAPVSRLGVSIMRNAGLPELIATSADEYVGIATALARDIDRLSELRNGMRDRLGQSALMDEGAFVAELESAYRSAWSAWCAKSPQA